MDKRTVLLMTSCINPNGMKYTELQNKEERRNQYAKAMKYYLENTDFRIVFCDNSGEKLVELLESRYVERVELLSFNGNNYDVNLGKGYGEFEIIRYALENSSFIHESQKVIKITGRLIIENIFEEKKLMDSLFCRPKHFVFANELRWAHEFDTRCFYASVDFFASFFLNQTNMINDSKGYFFEHLLYDTVIKLPSYYEVSDFVLPLTVKGVSGSTGFLYDDPSLNRLEKLGRIRDFCQYKKQVYKNSNRKIFLRLCGVSSMTRIRKFFVNRFA